MRFYSKGWTMKLYSETEDKAIVSAFVLEYIGDALCLLAGGFAERYGEMPFVFSGGVMSNSLIKNKIKKQFDAAFAEPSMSADNAVGIAYLTARNNK